MNLKILNGEHFIVSADPEAMGTILFCYAPSRDAIVINEKIPHLEKIVELMAGYLDLSDLHKKEVAEGSKSEAMRDYFNFLNKVSRIRRKLYRSMKRRTASHRLNNLV